MSKEKKIRTYSVAIPITGICYVDVEASSEEEAIDLAFEHDLEIEQWEAHRHVIRGNVFYGMQAEATAEEQGS